MAVTDYFRKAKSLYSSTTNSFGTGEGETITPASVSGLPTDTEMVLTFDKDVSGKLERILGTISGGNFVVSSGGRGYDGTTEQAHTSPVVQYVWNASDVNDRVTAWTSEHNQAGSHKTSVVAMLAGAQTFTGAKTFGTGLLKASEIVSSSASLILPTSSVSVTVPSATDTLMGKATTDTMTNKRITKRVSTEASSATPTINTDNVDMHTITALATNITSFTTNLSGTPVNGDTLIIRIQDSGSGQTIAWGASFESAGATLPTSITASKKAYVGLIWNSADSKWDCVAAIEEG